MLYRQTTAEGFIFYHCVIFLQGIYNVPSRRSDLAKSVSHKNQVRILADSNHML